MFDCLFDKSQSKNSFLGKEPKTMLTTCRTPVVFIPFVADFRLFLNWISAFFYTYIIYRYKKSTVFGLFSVGFRVIFTVVQIFPHNISLYLQIHRNQKHGYRQHIADNCDFYVVISVASCKIIHIQRLRQYNKQHCQCPSGFLFSQNHTLFGRKEKFYILSRRIVAFFRLIFRYKKFIIFRFCQHFYQQLVIKPHSKTDGSGKSRQNHRPIGRKPSVKHRYHAHKKPDGRRQRNDFDVFPPYLQRKTVVFYLF